ncbi:hypothetical protein WA158_007253 [Blastocystis sp. Blastoise]
MDMNPQRIDNIESMKKVSETITTLRQIFNSCMDQIFAETQNIFIFLEDCSKCLNQQVERMSLPEYGNFTDTYTPYTIIHDINPGYGTFFFTENKGRYPIKSTILDLFPDSYLSELYHDPTSRNENGCIYVDHSEKLFTYISHFMKGKPLLYSSLDDSLFKNLDYEFKYYNLPVPGEIEEYMEPIHKQRLWKSSVIPIRINNKYYNISKADLKSHYLYNTYFDKEIDSGLLYDQKNDALIFPRTDIYYFDYIYSVIIGCMDKFNEFNNKIIDLDKLKEEFEYFNIPLPSYIKTLEDYQKALCIWKSNSIKVKIGKKIYIISRSKLASRGLVSCYFNKEFDKHILYSEKTNSLILPGRSQFFKYIYDYIQTGVIAIDSKDRPFIDDIRNEFDSFSINLSQDIWNKFVALIYYFSESILLNDQYAYIVSQWVGYKRWILLYRGSRDGFDAEEFHGKCDNKGETIVIIKVINKQGIPCLFGGYTSISWTSSEYCKLVRDNKAFLFTLQNPHKIPPQRFESKPEGNNISHSFFCGPIFGGNGIDDICIYANSNKDRGGWTKFSEDGAYMNTTGKGKSLFVNNDKATETNWFKVNDIEVFGV